MTDDVLAIVNRSNQRGGRMLSVIDLIRARTLSRAQAAWILERILTGSSWMVGARPGGAGKTTIMSALLAMVPRPANMLLTNAGTGWEHSKPGDCVVSYEISAGSYDAYIWGEEVRRLCELAREGVRVVTNLHADTLAQARSQIVDQCGADDDGFAGLGMFIPVELSRRGGSVSRTVSSIEYNYAGSWMSVGRDPTIAGEGESIATFLDKTGEANLRTCEDVRTAWLEFLASERLLSS